MSHQLPELAKFFHGLCAQRFLLSTDPEKYHQQIVDLDAEIQGAIAGLFEHGWGKT